MRFCLSILLMALTLVAPAAAGQRVLLAPGGEAVAPAKQERAASALAALRKQAAQKGTVRVIVGLRVPFAAEGELAEGERKAQRQQIAGAATALRSRFSVAVARQPQAVRSYSSLPALAFAVTATELDRLATDPDVISITPDTVYRPADAQSEDLVRAPEAWAAGFSGLGYTIAIVDSGVDKTHPFLAGKVVSEACYSQGGYCPGGKTESTEPGSGMPCASKGCDHGTAVAGVAAGKGSNFSGIARDSTLIAIQVYSPGSDGAPTAFQSDVLAALNRVYELRTQFKIAAVNVSLGEGRFTDNCDGVSPVGAAIVANLRSAGIATVASSGNDGWTDAVRAPACFSEVVSVGAVWDGAGNGCNGAGAADQLWCDSNTSPLLSLLAPGAIITSSAPGGGYDQWAGTSMAAPHVSGAFAVLKQKWPDASVADLLARLQSTGKPVTDYRAPSITKPRIDVAAALKLVALSYTKAGTGDGIVIIMTPRGPKTCKANCTISLETGSSVSISAQPAGGSSFAGWGGACQGQGACKLRVDGSTSLTATFNADKPQALTFVKLGSGTGSVAFQPAGTTASCTGSCIQYYPTGTLVKLTATPGNRARFRGWSGACKGRKTCAVTMSAAKTVKARFTGK